MFFLIASLLNVAIYAQNPINKMFGGKPDGEIIDYYNNGSYYKYINKNNNLQGNQVMYYKNGDLCVMQQFDKGEFNGTNFYLNENKDTVYIEIYKHDTLLYTKNFSYYKNNVAKEIYTTSYKSDSTLIKSPFKDVEYKQGGFYFSFKYLEENVTNSQTYAKFYPSGTIMEYYIGSKNKADGKCFKYFKNGKVKVEAMYFNDKLNGLYLEYNLDGKVVKNITYKDGKIVK
ncbi:MAG TPA: hypothetical protein VK835_08175 [Bacteroidia bacterium]|nr:hypothetical protein [Bacteroidia bacterium]